jgi:hypothetical protein
LHLFFPFLSLQLTRQLLAWEFSSLFPPPLAPLPSSSHIHYLSSSLLLPPSSTPPLNGKR